MEGMIKKPIIILGIGRSGSKLVQNILNKNNKVYICPEMNFYSPYKTNIFKVIQNIKKDKDYSINLIKKVFKIKGKTSSFIKTLDTESLEGKILKTNPDAKYFFSILVREKAKIENPDATLIGAKFPFHFSFSSKFIKWYPNSKFIYLYRDPRAVLASELIMKSKISISSDFPISPINLINRIQINIYVFLQYFTYYRHLKALLNNDRWKNSKLLKFEKLILNTDNTIHEMSEFCKIEYIAEMKEIAVYGSSFHKKSKGFDKNTLNKWEDKLLLLEKILFKRVNRRFEKLFDQYNLDLPYSSTQ